MINMFMVFVWTLSDVIGAILLIVFCIIIIGLVLLVKISNKIEEHKEWKEQKKKSQEMINQAKKEHGMEVE